MLTVKDCMQRAWKCLLAGDTTGRDKWCDEAKRIQDQATRLRHTGNPSKSSPLIEIELVEGPDGVYAPKRPS